MALCARLARYQALTGEVDQAIANLETVHDAKLAAPALDFMRFQMARHNGTLQLAALLMMSARADNAAQPRQRVAERVEQLLDEVAQRAPNNPQLLTLRGELAALRGRLDEAAVHFDRAITSMDAPPVALLRLSAATHRQLGEWGVTVDRLQAILKRRPADPQSRLELATLQLHRGQYDKAAAHIDTLLQQRPGFVPAKRLKVQLLAQQGEIKAARALYDSLDANAQLGLLQLLTCAYLAKGQRDELLALLNAQLEQAPADVEALALMIDLDPEQVRQRHLLEQASKAGLHDRALQMLQGRLEQGPEVTTEDYLQRLSEKQSPSQRALFQANRAYQQGDWQGFEQHLKRALELRPDHEPLAKSLLEMQFELALHKKDWSEAERSGAPRGRPQP